VGHVDREKGAGTKDGGEKKKMRIEERAWFGDGI